MQRVDEIHAAITALNANAGARFAETVAGLAPLLSAAELEQWAEMMLRIADSGWHAFESANAYGAISRPLAESVGAAVLLDFGDIGFTLCGYSYEPSATWFRGVGQLLEGGKVECLQVISDTGQIVREKFPHASSLISQYFRIAFRMAMESDIDTLAGWCRVTRHMVNRPRGELVGFFDACTAISGIDWHFVDNLAGISVPVTLSYLAAYESIDRLVEPASRGLLHESIGRFAAADADVEAWLDAFRTAAAGLSPRARHELLVLTHKLSRMEHAMSLLEAVDRLPLERPEILESWLAGARDLGLDAACGYLSLASATSTDALERLCGQVNFAECHRLLQLYSEAMVGRRLALDTRTDEADHFRDLPATDGLSIYLPEVISTYPTQEENFQLFKMSLLHQLGYYEFGTFEFNFKGAWIAFRDYFATFDAPRLAAAIFQVLEDARIDWALARRYRGAALHLSKFKQDAIAAFADSPANSAVARGLDALVRFSLDSDEVVEDAGFAFLKAQVERLRDERASVYTTMESLAAVYPVIAEWLDLPPDELPEDNPQALPAEREPQEPAPVDFRGKLEPDRARLNLQLASLEEQDVEFSDEPDDSFSLSMAVDPKDVTIEKLKQGEVQEALGMMITDLEGRAADEAELDEDGKAALEEFRGRINEQPGPASDLAFRYDEWDCVIEDYRRRWCTLYEMRDLEEAPEYVEKTIKELRSVGRNVRRQLNNLKPELLRKVKGVVDGEELDMEKTVELMVDKRAGLSPEERIYVQRLRKDRDVSALFLLDMSASTDDRIPPPEGEAAHVAPSWDADDFLHDHYGADSEVDDRKRIIDLEKEAVILMADALEELGDSYSVCGFSGYGKDRVDFYLCKDFTEPYNIRAKGRIGGIKPCRSTRMGPAIRHATRRLVATESRIKAMIIISDGYPQDFDYGKDRNSKDYGIKDTTKALAEARQQGVQPFCLTVDPSGHDYLREMCPDHQYMVIQDINQLPDELSKVYRSLTG